MIFIASADASSVQQPYQPLSHLILRIRNVPSIATYALTQPANADFSSFIAPGIRHFTYPLKFIY